MEYDKVTQSGKIDKYTGEIRYNDLGDVTRACNDEETCKMFYFSKVEKAYYICPNKSKIRKMNGYRVYTKGNKYVVCIYILTM